MADTAVKIAILADASNATKGFDSAANAADKAGSSFDGVADSSDQVASKGAQAAGALSGLGGLVGGKFGAAMAAGGIAMQGFADAGDLVNVVTESAIVKKIKDAAVTAAQTTATIAKTVADKAAAAASKTWAAAQWLLNAALTANPIGLVVVAIVALVAAFVIAYQKSDKFRAVVTGAFDKVKAVASAAFGWVKKNWPLILAILTGPIGLATLAIVKNFDKIKAGFQAVIDWIKTVPGKIKDLGGKFLDAGAAIMGKIIDGIKSAAGFIGKIATGIWEAVKGLLNKAIDKINAALEFKIDLPLGKSITIDPPDIPHLATGGIITSPTLALLGEAGREAVLPLDRGGLLGTVNVYKITLQVPVGASSADIGRTLVKHIDAYEAAGGRRRA